MVLWSSEKPPPLRWPEIAVPLIVIEGHRKVRDGKGHGRMGSAPKGWELGRALPEFEPKLDFKLGLKKNQMGFWL